MFVFKKLNSLITSQDTNGALVNFNFFKNSNKHKSLCGGIISVASLIGAVVFIFIKGTQMIKRDNTANGSSVQEQDPYQLHIPDLK